MEQRTKNMEGKLMYIRQLRRASLSPASPSPAGGGGMGWGSPSPAGGGGPGWGSPSPARGGGPGWGFLALLLTLALLAGCGPTLPKTPMPAVTPAPTPVGKTVDAFAASYFPFANLNPSDFANRIPQKAGRISKFQLVDGPPFFTFDLQEEVMPGAPSKLYHVRGVDTWVTSDAGRLSPTISRERAPADGDMVWVQGELVDPQNIVASYVGLLRQGPWYYRSLWSAAELRPDLPDSYRDLKIWVRGTLDTADRWGGFYVLPEGGRLDARYLGREALLGGQIVLGVGLQVNAGIDVVENGRYVRVFQAGGTLPLEEGHAVGTIKALAANGRTLTLQPTEGAFTLIALNPGTELYFLDGKPAALSDLQPGRSIRVDGQSAGKDSLLAKKVFLEATTGASTTPGASAAPSASQGSVRLLYLRSQDGSLWLANLDGSGARQVATPQAQGPGISSATVAPDGQRLVYILEGQTSSTLRLLDLRSGASKDLVGGDVQAADPAWSPDGQRLLFQRFHLTGDQLVDEGLWQITLSDGQLTQVVPPVGEDWLTLAPVWSPDSQSVAFGRANYAADTPPQVFVLSLGGQPRQVFDGGSDWQWSPDSQRLLVTKIAADGTGSLWVVNRDGTGAKSLTPKGSGDYGGRWAPSPSGSAQRIAFLSSPAGSVAGHYLWIMNADGSGRKQLTKGEVYAGQLLWTPDGQTIIFARVGAEGFESIWTIRADGTGLRQITTEASAPVAVFLAP